MKKSIVIVLLAFICANITFAQTANPAKKATLMQAGAVIADPITGEVKKTVKGTVPLNNLQIGIASYNKTNNNGDVTPNGNGANKVIPSSISKLKSQEVYPASDLQKEKNKSNAKSTNGNIVNSKIINSKRSIDATQLTPTTIKNAKSDAVPANNKDEMLNNKQKSVKEKVAQPNSNAKNSAAIKATKMKSIKGADIKLINKKSINQK